MNAIIWADPAVRLKKHAELMALRADNARLRAELNAALDALRAAPEPMSNESISEWTVRYGKWWLGRRQAALKEVG